MDGRARFEEIRRTLVERNAFYGERLRNGAPLEDLPFTTKEEIVEDQIRQPPFGTNLTYPIEQYTRIHQTSGTTGKPLFWLDTRESWEWWLRCWEEVYRGAGVRRGDRVYVAFSFGPFIGFWAAFEAAQRLGVMALSGGGQTTEQRVNSIVERAATVLVCTPTYALRLAETANRMGMDVAKSAVRATIHAGEPGASIPATRQRIQEAFGARTYDHIGMTEMGAYGFECEAQAGVHINEDEFIAEVVDGELVLTNLGRAGMPLIRYRTGDRVVLSSDPCSCGRTSARLIGGVLGRTDDMICIRGVNIFPSAIENVIRRDPRIVEFGIEVTRHREMHELVINVEIADSVNPASVLDRLYRDIADDLRIRPSIHHVAAGSLPRFELKAKRVRWSSRE